MSSDRLWSLPIGTLHAIYAILQFINRIIVTLHFFCWSKLFYFSEVLNFNFRFWMPGIDLVGGRNPQKSSSYNRGAGGAPSPPGLGFPSLKLRVDKIDMNCSEYNILSTVKVLSTRSVKHGYNSQKTENRPNSTKTQKNMKIVRMTSYSQVWLSKKSATQKYKFLIFRDEWGRFRRYTGKKTNNRQNSAMNFRNSQIVMVRCLEGRDSYQKVKSVLNSDEKWICYSISKKKRLFPNQFLADLKCWFSKIVNSRPRESCVVSNCSVRRERTCREIKIVIALETTELTHGNRIHLKKLSIIIFMQQSLWRDKLWAAML